MKEEGFQATRMSTAGQCHPMHPGSDLLVYRHQPALLHHDSALPKMSRLPCCTNPETDIRVISCLCIMSTPSIGILWISAVSCLIVRAIKISHIETLDGLQTCLSKVVDVGVCCGQGQHSLCATRAKATNKIGWQRSLFAARGERSSFSTQLGCVLRRLCMHSVDSSARSSSYAIACCATETRLHD